MKNEAPGATVSRAEFLNLFAAVFLPMFLAAVDQTLLATATPAIADSLGGLRDTSWIAVAYLLTTATIVPVYGRLGDLKGRRNMLLAIMVVSTVYVLYYLRSERSWDVVFGVVYAYFSFFALIWIFPYAALTLRARGWLTR